MNKEKNRKIMYGILASCAMFAIGVGIITTQVPFGQNDETLLQAKIEKEDLSKEKETLKTEININKLDEIFELERKKKISEQISITNIS